VLELRDFKISKKLLKICNTSKPKIFVKSGAIVEPSTLSFEEQLALSLLLQRSEAEELKIYSSSIEDITLALQL